MRPRILKNDLQFSGLQEEILVGLLLGDGCLERTKNSLGARLKVDQSIKQIEFATWLYEQFSDFVRTPPRIKNGKINQEIVFNTLTHPIFKVFYDLFYPEGKKIIPVNISQLLTTTALTVWFMGDGSIKSKECKGRILNTQSFTRTDIERLIEVLREKFNLQPSIRTQKDGLQIYISAKSAIILHALLKDRILPFFRYKLPLKS